MIKIGKPKGLIRFASYNSIKNSVQRIITPRVLGYCVVLVILAGLLTFVLATRSAVETTVLKVSGTLYQRTDDGYITNLYNVEFVNKTFDEITLQAKIESPGTALLQRVDGKPIVIPAEGIVKGVFFIKIPQADVHSARTIVRLGIYKDGEQIEKLKVKFIGPVSKSSDMNSRLEDDENE
jgi:polyferredoxin